MRVLIVSHYALPHVGGVENLVDLEVRALADAGHEVVLLTSDGTGAGREPQYGSCVRIVRSWAWHLLERKLTIPYPIFGLGFWRTLWREVAAADVVHAHGFMFMNSAAAILVARLQGKRSILTDHGGIQKFNSKLATFVARLGAETVGRISATYATRNISYNGRVVNTLNHLARRRDAEFLPNPIDGTLFYPPTAEARRAAREQLGWPAGRKKVLFAGRIIATKGVPLVLAATDPSYDLVFCGPGDLSLLGALPRAGVEYLPPRPQAELRQLYHAADALVLPAEVREGFPLVVQEAVACGLPVVLGYDPGFEPYRALPNLFFCERTPESVRWNLQQALVAESAPKSDFFPSLERWIRSLYQLPPDLAENSCGN